MADTERPIPPSSGRIAAAAKAGVFPTSNLLPSGISLLLTAALGWLFAEPVLRGANVLMTLSVERAVSPGGAPVSSLESAAAGVLGPVLLFFALLFTGAFAGAGVPALIARRRAGRTAVPLPQIPAGTLPLGMLRLFGAGLFLLIALAVVRSAAVNVQATPSVLLSGGRAVCQLTAVLGGILILLGLIEWTLRRHLIFRALHLNTAEARRESRAHEGEPNVKRRQLARARSQRG